MLKRRSLKGMVIDVSDILPEISEHLKSEWEYISSEKNDPDRRLILMLEVLSVSAPLSESASDLVICRLLNKFKDFLVMCFTKCILSNAKEDRTLVHLFSMPDRPLTLGALIDILSSIKDDQITALDILNNRLNEGKTDLMPSKSCEKVLSKWKYLSVLSKDAVPPQTGRRSCDIQKCGCKIK